MNFRFHSGASEQLSQLALTGSTDTPLFRYVSKYTIITEAFSRLPTPDSRLPTPDPTLTNPPL
ncbi:hypothetical protein [Moorena producens]|uniref:hypothetical protein n=1 Tax=Moorena producens TaxID=1155739 RepID=UPI001313F8AE|nr:hypothetical protein [Moorena producens]